MTEITQEKIESMIVTNKEANKRKEQLYNKKQVIIIKALNGLALIIKSEELPDITDFIMT